jgi:hypothetical protein
VELESCLLRKATRRVIWLILVHRCLIATPWCLFPKVWSLFSAIFFSGSVAIFSFLYRVPVRGALRFCRHVPISVFADFRSHCFSVYNQASARLEIRVLFWVLVILSLRPVRLSFRGFLPPQRNLSIIG